MDSSPPNRHRNARRAGVVMAALLLAAVLALALTRLNLPHVAHALLSASPGWLLLALVLMMLSLLARAASWRATLLAALPDARLPWGPVMRATMIGVMASAVFPGQNR